MDNEKIAYLRGKLEGGLTIIDLLDQIVNQQDLTGREELIKNLVEHVKRMYLELLEALSTGDSEDIAKIEEKIKKYHKLLPEDHDDKNLLK